MTDLGPANQSAEPTREELLALERTWAPRPGFWGFLCETHHTAIGKRFLLTAMTFFGLAGVLALIMRLQLARPENHLLGPDLYDQLFTVHGSTMMFLFAVPVMEGLAIYFVPLMVGTRNAAFPRLNAFAYWTYLIGGVFVWVGLFSNTGPDAGWFAYVPLSGPQYGPGKRMDIWAQLITFTELSGLAGAVSTIATVFTQRAPGMSLKRLPLFVWAQLITAFMILFAMPAIVVASTMLGLDRLVGTHFFNVMEGGDPLLWQHLFWFFGHPEVYMIFIPATGLVSTIIVNYARRQILGYTWMVLALVSTAFLGFGLWVHHMFATGLPQLGQSFFTGASLLIAIPSGIQILAWILTLWSGKPRWSAPPLMFVGGFLFIFVVGGLSGVMLASIPLDVQVHDTMFVVAHFHYVLIGGAVFPLLGALHMWIPKITGRLLDERLGRASFWLAFVGFNLTFFPLHQLGLHGMPRRVYTYVPGLGWERLNLLATVGAFVLGLGVLAFVANFLRSLSSGEIAGPDPVGGATLEWAASSPPAPYNFARVPVVSSLAPQWESPETAPVVVGLRADKREVLVTRLLDAEPDHRAPMPGPTAAPLFVALCAGITFISGIFQPWGAVIGATLAVVPTVWWFWPKGEPNEKLEEQP